MQRRLFLGLDVGSYGSKGAVVDEQGRLIASSDVTHGMEMPGPGMYEHDADAVWWHDCCALCKKLMRTGEVDPADVAAVGVSALGTDCLPVDVQGRPLRKAILYGIDARASQELKELTQLWGEEKILQSKGEPLSSEDVIGKALWIQRHEPEVWKKTAKICTASTYLTFKLTGRFVIDAFLARGGFFPAYRRDGTLNEEALRPLFSPSLFAEAHASTDVVGVVTPQAAKETGLVAGTPVITGTDDAAAESISCGVLAPGDLMAMLGSSTYLICVSQGPVRDARIWNSGYVIPGVCTMQGATNNNGTVLRWLRDQVFADLVESERAGGENAYQAMMRLGQAVLPGCEGLTMLPYFAGERTPLNDPQAKGVFFGLELRHTRAHLYRAALEAIACSVASHVHIFREHKAPVKCITAIGGGTKNPLMLQIIADACGLPVRVPEVTVGAAYGDALMAGIGAGAFDGFDALANVIRYRETYMPRAEQMRVYARVLEKMQRLYAAAATLMHEA